MKRFLSMVMVLAAALVSFAEVNLPVSLAEARSRISSAVSDTAVMTATMSGLSAADQVTFLGEVNAVIGKLSASPEISAALYLNSNLAAYRSAKKGNLAALLAETFATVPPAALTVINERLAENVFNRNADPAQTISDEQYIDISTNVMAKIVARTSALPDAGVRDTFAALMFLRASNGTPLGLRTLLTSMLPKEVQTQAADVWIPAAMGDNGVAKSYEQLVNAGDRVAGSASGGRMSKLLARLGFERKPDSGSSDDEGEEDAAPVETKIPDPQVVLRLAGPQLVDAMLFDLMNGNGNNDMVNAAYGIDSTHARIPGDEWHMNRTPGSHSKDDPWYPHHRRGEADYYPGQGSIWE